MKYHSSDVFSGKHASLVRSWCWVRKDFEDDYKRLRQSGALNFGGPSECIWDTGDKFVLKVHTPEGLTAAYKQFRVIRNKRFFFFRLSPNGRELQNYYVLRSLDLPTAPPLAGGETRIFNFLTSSFFISEFIEGTRDGGAFLGDELSSLHTDYRDEFCRKNMTYLARMHGGGFLHRGATPYNMLWREKKNGTQGDRLEIFWIDLANVRKVPRFIMRKKFINDLAKYFIAFTFAGAELEKYVEIYCSSAGTPDGYTVSSLTEEIEKKISSMRSRKKKK